MVAFPPDRLALARSGGLARESGNVTYVGSRGAVVAVEQAVEQQKANADLQRLERECQRLVQARVSLERLCLELRSDLMESERGNRLATGQVRRLGQVSEHRAAELSEARRRVRQLARDAERRDTAFSDARRRVRQLAREAERRDAEFSEARGRVRQLAREAERRAAEFSESQADMQRLERECQRLLQVRVSLERLCLELRRELVSSENQNLAATDRLSEATRRVRQLEREAERRDAEYAETRRRLRSLKRQSTDVATAFLAVTASRSWRLGNALLAFPRLVVGRRRRTAVDDLQPLATALAGGRDAPDPKERPGHADGG